jgi:aminoglycoside 6'-N-acetyltransferase
MRLRCATAADLKLLQRWARQPHVIAEISDDERGWEVELHKTPGWREQLIAEVAGHPVGFV